MPLLPPEAQRSPRFISGTNRPVYLLPASQYAEPRLQRMLQGRDLRLLSHMHHRNAQMMDRLGDTAKLEPPEDGTVTTLYVGSITPSMHEEDIVEPFRPFGEVRRPLFP